MLLVTHQIIIILILLILVLLALFGQRRGTQLSLLVLVLENLLHLIGSSFHYGIDIGAPMGTNIIAIFSGQVTFIGFNGANGYTVTVTNGDISSSYSHVSPNFIVYKGQFVNQGERVAVVGPKNVYGVPNNPYKDSNGNPTNRQYYWTAFTFKYKKRRQSRRSIRLLLV